MHYLYVNLLTSGQSIAIFKSLEGHRVPTQTHGAIMNAIEIKNELAEAIEILNSIVVCDDESADDHDGWTEQIERLNFALDCIECKNQ